jgi:formate C-acetyltransferase
MIERLSVPWQRDCRVIGCGRITFSDPMLDGYMASGGHHLNVNVFDVSHLMDAMEHPELYPQLTIRVSGYAVNFIKLTREQQLDIIQRTFHASM